MTVGHRSFVSLRNVYHIVNMLCDIVYETAQAVSSLHEIYKDNRFSDWVKAWNCFLRFELLSMICILFCNMLWITACIKCRMSYTIYGLTCSTFQLDGYWFAHSYIWFLFMLIILQIIEIRLCFLVLKLWKSKTETETSGSRAWKCILQNNIVAQHCTMQSSYNSLTIHHWHKEKNKLFKLS